MDDSEQKLMALKKAYAEIILNTAKEAASRIVVSEKKAFRYQQELFAAKEEGLRMLLRLKQMLDSKVHEAEMVSLSQQRRIEELEAQLGEAEDIVKDLRVELGELQDELERVTNQMQLLNEQNSRGETAAPVETSDVDGLNTFQSLISPYPVQSEFITTSAMKNPLWNGTCEIKQCLHKHNCYTCNSDFASIVMRNKKPELYRNGCTQRIRALERSLLTGDVSLSGKEDNIENELSVKEDKEGEDTCIEPFVKADICRMEENLDKFEGMQADDNCTQGDAIRTSHRKRKRATRFKKYKSSSSNNLPDQIVETCQTSSFPDNMPFACHHNYIVGVGEDSQMIENNFHKDPESTLTLKSVSGTAKIDTQVDREEVTGEDNEEVIKACTTQKNEKLLTDKMELRGESACAQNLEVPASNPDIEAVDLSSVNSVVSVSNLTEVPTQPVNSKFLKYTFSRKRKKESLSSPDSDRLFETDMKRNTEEEKNSTLELRSQKSSLITESPGDSWPLAQLAHQLISLFENK